MSSEPAPAPTASLRATYRVQVNQDFTLDDAAAIAAERNPTLASEPDLRLTDGGVTLPGESAAILR